MDLLFCHRDYLTHYNSFMKRLYQFRYYIYASVPLTGFISAYLLASGGSPCTILQGFDMIFFTLCTVFLILLASSKLRSIPTFFTRISQYSFGIYLIHPLIVSIITRFMGLKRDSSTTIYSACLSTSHSQSRFQSLQSWSYRLPFGIYMIGRIGWGPTLKGRSATSQANNRRPSRKTHRTSTYIV